MSREHFDLGRGFHGTDMESLSGMLKEGARGSSSGNTGPGLYITHPTQEESTSGKVGIGEKSASMWINPTESSPVVVAGDTGIKNPKVMKQLDWYKGAMEQTSEQKFNASIKSQGYDAIHFPEQNVSVLLHPEQFHPTHMKEIPEHHTASALEQTYALARNPWDELR